MIKFFMNTVKKKSLVILISDFIDKDYDKNMRALTKKHDVVCLHIYDDYETNIPNLGIIELEEKENNFRKWVNTSSSRFKKLSDNLFISKPEELKKKMNAIGINYLKINSKENYVKNLIKLFKYRKKR